jgi:aspartate beta-hydroxylase
MPGAMSTVAEARELLQAGRLSEAERACERILKASPSNTQALSLLAVATLRSGQPSRASALLERALQLAPQDGMIHQHLGLTRAALGDVPGAIEAYRAAVRLQPDLHVARLQLANALEQTGDARGALLHFSRALGEMQSRGYWTNASTTPPALQAIVAYASRVVRTGRRALFSEALTDTATRYGADSVARVRRCLSVYLREEEPVYPDPRQLPTFLYFPDLPASPYLSRELFPWIEALEAQTDVIRNELLALLQSEEGSERVFTTTALEQQNLRGLSGPPSWNGYYFYRHGVRREDNCSKCPVTASALEALPLARVREHAPEVLFSVFTPGTHLLPHRGVTNTRVVGHLPLMVPEDCALSVGGEIHAWQEGRVVVFDDTYEHEAWNRSSRTRVVLIFDLWNPHLTEAERAATAALIEAIGDFRVAMEQA